MTDLNPTESFTYTIYIQASPEQIWRGLTEPDDDRPILETSAGRSEDFPLRMDDGFHVGPRTP